MLVTAWQHTHLCFVGLEGAGEDVSFRVRRGECVGDRLPSYSGELAVGSLGPSLRQFACAYPGVPEAEIETPSGMWQALDPSSGRLAVSHNLITNHHHTLARAFPLGRSPYRIVYGYLALKK